MWLLGIDTGGTFTDFVLYDGASLRIHKRISTPAAPAQAILQGIADLGIEPEKLTIIHGSTVATNAVLEDKGVKTAYITNRGFGDVLTIGRQARRALYALQPAPVKPPVERELCLETGGRISATGDVIEPLSEADLDHLCAQVASLSPQAVAINLLFSFLDPSFEQRIEARLADSIFVSRASFILPQYKEYERGITTWLNASVGPLVQRYINQLERELPTTPISIMQSAGGTIAANQAGKFAVHMLLSGPAGGLAGAAFIGKSCHRPRLLTFDMGGTSTDVALIDGQIKLTTEARINQYPVSIPMVDVHTIGAGGGSIAWLDEGGLLQVGPQSAGSAPGPACYDLGGEQPTVTDANLVLGRLPGDAKLGGTMTLSLERARVAIASLADKLALSVEETALGIIRIANEHMAEALRVISIQRGLDPRHFTLMSFGGAGGLHVCALAESLGMREAIAPIHAGVLSALGMITSPRSRHLVKTVPGLLTQLRESTLLAAFDSLALDGCNALVEENINADEIKETRSLDVRYAGQSYTLNIPWLGLDQAAAQFHQQHEQRYGHRLALAIEVVNIHVIVSGPTPQITLHAATPPHTHSEATRTTIVYGIDAPVAVIERGQLQIEMHYLGPLVISEATATTFLAPGWQCVKDSLGNLLLSRTASCSSHHN